MNRISHADVAVVSSTSSGSRDGEKPDVRMNLVGKMVLKTDLDHFSSSLGLMREYIRYMCLSDDCRLVTEVGRRHLRSSGRLHVCRAVDW